MLNPLLAGPVFALLIGLEAWYATRRGKDFHSGRDTWTNIFKGLASVGFNILFGVFIGAI